MTPVVDLDALLAAVERVVALVRRLAPPTTGLSPTTAATLSSLEVLGPGRLSDLAAGQCVTQPAMSQLVSRLERAGLARRDTKAGDARVVLVSITPAGRELLRRGRQARAERLAELLADLPERDLDCLRAAQPALDLLGGLDLPASPRTPAHLTPDGSHAQ
jgi:DNA-binding MarR family transcriptional regulator